MNELVKRLGELAWTLDAQGRKDDSVTCSKAAAALSAVPEEATPVPSKRELITTKVGDDAIIYLQLMNFEDDEWVDVMVTPSQQHSPQDDSRSEK